MLRCASRVLTAAARSPPVGPFFQAARVAVSRSLAKLPTAALKPAVRVEQPALLHDLAAATDGTTARKLLNSNRLGIVGRLQREPGFVRTLVAFREFHELQNTQLVSLCTRDSVAKRLGTPEFDSALKVLRDEYRMDTAQLVTIMCDGLAKRLGTPVFDDALRVLRDEYRMDTAQLVTFTSNSVAKRLGTPVFDDALKLLRDEYRMDTAQLVTLMCDGVAKRLHDERFQSALGKVVACAGVPCCVRLFSSNQFSSRISDVVDDFCALVEHCRLNASNAEAVVTLLGNNVKLISVIPQLRRRLGSVHGDALRSAMSEFSGTYGHKSAKAKELMLNDGDLQR